MHLLIQPENKYQPFECYRVKMATKGFHYTRTSDFFRKQTLEKSTLYRIILLQGKAGWHTAHFPKIKNKLRSQRFALLERTIDAYRIAFSTARINELPNSKKQLKASLPVTTTHQLIKLPVYLRF